jgi:serine/threonine-protein kinase
VADGPAGSRKNITRVGWHGPGRDEESRAYLQSRLTVLSKLTFWSFVVLLGGMVLLYETNPQIEPRDNNEIYLIATIGLVIEAIIWRGFLVRRQLKLEWLYAIDLFYALSTGLIFGAASFIAWDLQASAFANMLWSCFMVFLRAIVVPSTAKRTAVAGVLLFLPLNLAALGLALWHPEKIELPGDAYVESALVISTAVIVLVSIGSQIIYGLRKQVSAAMRLGSYTLDRKIGEGGNGSVYRAHHAMLRRPTAVKLVHPEKAGAETLDRFEREVQHMSQLTHWNTVAVYDYGRSPEGIFYYAMEYLDGIDLENLVIEFGPQPAARVISIMTQVCAALGEAHRRGIIHRDVKPANIILCERGDVPDVAKVVDFGLAKAFAADDPNLSDATGESTSKNILGTPAYIAPEAITDPEKIGPSVDLYALGAVAYFLLTGRRVFDGKTAVDLCVQHVTRTPKPPSEMTKKPIPKRLEEIILQCLAKKPEQRPESAAALAALLKSVPEAEGWSEADAAQWWVKFRNQQRPLGSSASTLSITVDLGDRDDIDPAA